MTRIHLEEHRLKIEVLGWHKFWSFKSRLDLPIEHIIGAKRFEKTDWRGGLRSPGTYLPGVIRAGSYCAKGKWYFWDACRMENTVVIALKDERYAGLFVETESPEEIIAAIQTVIAR